MYQINQDKERPGYQSREVTQFRLECRYCLEVTPWYMAQEDLVDEAAHFGWETEPPVCCPKCKKRYGIPEGDEA